MDIKDCIDFANKTKDCSMATVEGNKPRVRMMGMWFADQTGFYFQAWTFKDVYKQLNENPNIEVCFYSKDKENLYSMMRVRGVVEFLDDINLKEKVLRDRPFLKDLGATGPDDPRIVIFLMSHGEASFWPKKKEGEYPGIEKVVF